jgi:hypothetical protein
MKKKKLVAGFIRKRAHCFSDMQYLMQGGNGFTENNINENSRE